MRHAQDLPTLATNCYEIERAMPYQPVIDLVTRALDRVSAAALRKLAPVSLAELAALVPEIGERFPGLPQLSNDFPEARQARLPRAVDQLLEAARGGRPSDPHGGRHPVGRRRQRASAALPRPPRRAAPGARDLRLSRRGRRQRRAARTAGREPAPRDRRAPRAARPAGACRYRERWSRRSPTQARHTRSGRAPASRNRRQSVLPDFDPAVPERGRDAAGTTASAGTGIAPGRVACRRARAARARAQGAPADARNRRGPRPALRLRHPARRDARARGAAARRGGGAGQAPFAARGTRGRRIRFQPRQGCARWSIATSAGRGAGCCISRWPKPWNAAAKASERAERDAQLAEHYERAHVWSKALHYLVLAGERSQALFAMRDALHWLDRAVALSESHPESLDESQRLRDLRAARGGARTGRADPRRGSRHSPRRRCGARRRRTRTNA